MIRCMCIHIYIYLWCIVKVFYSLMFIYFYIDVPLYVRYKQNLSLSNRLRIVYQWHIIRSVFSSFRSCNLYFNLCAEMVLHRLRNLTLGIKLDIGLHYFGYIILSYFLSWVLPWVLHFILYRITFSILHIKKHRLQEVTRISFWSFITKDCQVTVSYTHLDV